MNTLYVIANPLFPNYIKIGHTNNLYSRLKKLSTAVPMAYKVLYKKEYENAKKIEAHLHAIYRKELHLNLKCVSHEWYPFGEREFFDTVEDFLKDIQENINWFIKVENTFKDIQKERRKK